VVASWTYLACYFLGGLVGSLGQIFDRAGWAARVAGVGASIAVAAPSDKLRRCSLRDQWVIEQHGAPARSGIVQCRGISWIWRSLGESNPCFSLERAK
jgi:hypothetical protein